MHTFIVIDPKSHRLSCIKYKSTQTHLIQASFRKKDQYVFYFNEWVNKQNICYICLPAPVDAKNKNKKN